MSGDDRRTMARAFCAAIAGSVMGGGGALADERDCPWIVQPYVSEALLEDGRPAFDIMYDGLERRRFYAFTVRAPELADRLRAGGSLPPLDDRAHPLEAVTTPLDTDVYRLDPSATPPTIFLAASEAPVPELERIGAAFQPSRAVAVSQYVPRFRGATDRSGALPPPSPDPTVVAAATAGSSLDLTVCAYEIAAR